MNLSFYIKQINLPVFLIGKSVAQQFRYLIIIITLEHLIKIRVLPGDIFTMIQSSL